MRPYVLNEYQRIRNDLITRLVIFLTYRCNFNCSYCYVNKKETKELSANKLIKIIKELKTKNNEIKEINFMGGEPLLRFDVIKEIINIFGNEFVFNLNTNGYLLDKETLDFLLKNNVIIVLSLDGSEKTHNLNRKDKTFNKILNNIKGYEDKVIVNYVINPNSIDNLIKDFENLVNLGFKKIDVRPNSDYLWRKDELDKLDKEVLKFYRLYFNKYKEKGVGLILDKVIGKRCFYENERGCNELKISPEGYFFSCCRLCNAYRKEDMNFGKKVFDCEKREKFLSFARDKINIYRKNKRCDGCNLRSYCLCLIDSFYLAGSDFDAWFNSYCRINKIMIGNLIKTHDQSLKVSQRIV